MDFFLFLLSLVSLCGVSLQQNCCPMNYALHITRNVAICIREVTTSASFQDALTVCGQVSRGSLLKLDPISELEVVVPAGNSNYWIGLRRDGNTWRWTADDTEPTGFNWINDSPPDTFDCVRLNGGRRWDAASCTTASTNYICQAEVDCAESTCLTAVTQRRCPCDVGYLKQGDACSDINECDDNQCSGPNTQCINLPGSYECPCVAGTSRKAMQTECTLDEECTDDSGCSGDNTVCRASFDSRRRCQCATGYSGNPCSDIDECSCDSAIAQCVNGQKCAGVNEVCRNTAGSFSCDCPSGYQRLANNFCVDIDECSDGTTCRGERQTCSNTAGSYICTCDAGYTLENADCVESCLNRCDPGTEECTQPAGGSPVCSCRTGYARSPNTGLCEDVNECRATPPVCDPEIDNIVCVNTPGSFVCECRPGFSENNDRVCVDINECADNSMHNCRTAGDCINTAGSFMCACGSNEILINNQCRVLRGFRIKIFASEFNGTTTTYDSSMDRVYEHHFCKTILDNLEVAYPTVPYDCSQLRFESGSVRGFLLVRMLSSTLRADAIENTLEIDVVLDVSGDQLLYSTDRMLSLTIKNPTADIGVQDVALYSSPCNPSPCQNNAACLADDDVYDVDCVNCAIGFSGELCEIGATGPVVPMSPEATSAPSDADQTLIIVIIIIAVVVVVILIACVCCCCCFFCLQGGGGFGGPAAGAPSYGGPAAYRPGVAPIEGPPTIAGYGGQGGYYDTNSVL